ncbi:MAG: hypothetical protein EA401_08755 [Planctomycetota bacterium]|nr:MAG: hypothetical protein EA401_08755 [Planctomycetota bacterium]
MRPQAWVSVPPILIGIDQGIGSPGSVACVILQGTWDRAWETAHIAPGLSADMLQSMSPEQIAHLIRARRTHKRFSGAAVSPEHLSWLVELLRWAPNHRVTQPWRAYVLDQPATHALGKWIADHRDVVLRHSDKPEKDRAKIEKLLSYYFPSLGAIIQVTQVRAPSEHQDREDYAAVSAGVQNMLLGAESLGLGHFWSTAATLCNPAVLQHLGIDPERERMVASLWLGGVVAQPPVPPRQDPDHYTTWISPSL